MTRKTKVDVYQEITNQLIKLLEGSNKWTRPWLSVDVVGNGLPYNIAGREYHGINVPMLWASAMEYGYEHNTWATFKQWKELGANIRKGEKSTVVCFFKPIKIEDADTGEEREIPIARAFRVFNVAQVDGYEMPKRDKPSDKPLVERIAHAEAFIANVKADIRHGGSKAFYRRELDYIQVPEIDDFIETESASAQENYYSTLFHELAHWTGDGNRLDREKGKRFGDDKYAIEELCAEISSSFTCALLGITPVAKPETAAYLQSWLAALKNDKKWFFNAASAAQKATTYLADKQPVEMDQAA